MVDGFRMRIASAGHRIYWRACDLARIARRYGVAPAAAAQVVRDVAPPVASPATEAAGARYVFTATISDGEPDRLGDTIAVNGWDLRAYGRNPVVLWAHDSHLPPIGRAVSTWSDGHRLRASAVLATGANPFAASIAELIKARALVALSVGFQPIKWEWSKDPGRGPLAINFIEQELLEFSVVPIPANPRALIDAPTSAKSAAVRQRERKLAFLRLAEPPRAFVPRLSLTPRDARRRARARVLEAFRLAGK